MAVMVDIMLAEERVRDLRREAAGWRRAAEFYRGLSSSGGGGGSGREIPVRWGLAADVSRVARVLELNGRPRWEASEERFIVAEEAGEIVAALPCRTEVSRLAVGEVVADPWGGEEELAVALYRGAVALALAAGLEGVTVKESRTEYPGRAGYVRDIRGWRADVAPRRRSAGRGELPARGIRRALAIIGHEASPRYRTPGV